MAKYIICEKCKEFVPCEVTTTLRSGMTFRNIVCPKCGHIKESNTNHIHYGNDGK